MTFQLPMWAVFALLGLTGQLLIAVFIRKALGGYRDAVPELARAVRMYLARSNKLYLVGRVRRAAGQNTVWDVMGLFTTEESAAKACKGKLDFYICLGLDSLQNDNNYRPAPLVFPYAEEQKAS